MFLSFFLVLTFLKFLSFFFPFFWSHNNAYFLYFFLDFFCFVSFFEVSRQTLYQLSIETLEGASRQCLRQPDPAFVVCLL